MKSFSTILPLLLVLPGACACHSQDPSRAASEPDSAGHPPVVAETEERTGTAPPTDFRRQFVAAAKAIRPAVVSINSTATTESRGEMSPFHGTPFERFFQGPPGREGPSVRRGVGSGTIIDTEGHILTNNHVIANADRVRVVLADDREFDAKVIGTDAKTDVAVVKIEPGDTKLKAAVLGDSSKLEVGEWVVACGSPFGLKQTISVGVVSAVGRGDVGISEYEDFIQTDAAINPGNSGGPLVDVAGRVIGINTAIASGGGGNVGVGFAIPIEMASQVMRQLLEHGKVVRGYVGLYIGDVTEELAGAFDYSGSDGVLVQDVSDDGPAARAGVEAGDIIMERDGKPVANAAEFRNAIAATAPDTEVELKLWRGGKALTKRMKLGRLSDSGEVQVAGGAQQPARWGVQLSDVPAELKSQLPSNEQQGALITRVEGGSPADDSGLRAGDVLVAVGNDAVRSAADAKRLLTDAKSPVRVRILREGRGLFLVLTARRE
jgi:serine protease Do